MSVAFRAVRQAVTKTFAIAAVLFLAACNTDIGNLGASGPSVNPSKPVPVALLVPKSHPQAGTVAASLERAARLAISELDGVQVDLRVYDTAGNAAQAAQQAQIAVDAGAKIILGPLYGDAANEVGKVAAAKNVNVLSFSNNTDIAGGNVFVLGSTFANTAKRLLTYAKGHGKSKIVIVHADNVEGQFGRNAIQQAAVRSGVTVTGVQSFPFSQQGVVSAVPAIRSTVRSTGADSVFITSSSAGALPLLLQLMPEAGLSPETTQYIGLTRWDVPPQTLALPGAQGSWFTLPNQDMLNAFQARYNSAYGSDPHQLAGLAFDGIAAIGALVKSGRKDALSTTALTQAAGFQGTGGVFRLLTDGTNERALAVATVENNQVVILDRAPTSFGGFGF